MKRDVISQYGDVLWEDITMEELLGLMDDYFNETGYNLVITGSSEHTIFVDVVNLTYTKKYTGQIARDCYMIV